jgi:CBS domain-containing protein
MVKTVKHILDKKGHTVWTIAPNALVFDALKMMNKHKIGSLPVMRGEKMAGILTARDYARKVVRKGRAAKQTPVSAIMTRKVVHVSPDRTVSDCMDLMTEKRVRHLPVLAEKKLVGIVSIGDLAQASLEEKEFVIEQLSKYIWGLEGN